MNIAEPLLGLPPDSMIARVVIRCPSCAEESQAYILPLILGAHRCPSCRRLIRLTAVLAEEENDCA